MIFTSPVGLVLSSGVTALDRSIEISVLESLLVKIDEAFKVENTFIGLIGVIVFLIRIWLDVSIGNCCTLLNSEPPPSTDLL